MRTTLTIEPDVAQQIRKRIAQKKCTLKQVVNEALRAGLSATAKEPSVQFRVQPHAFQFKQGIDTNKLNQLLDYLEADELLKKMSR